MGVGVDTWVLGWADTLVDIVVGGWTVRRSGPCDGGFPISNPPQWGAADTVIKVPSVDNTHLKGSPFKARNRSVYSQTCYAYCQGFLSFLLISTLPVHSPAFFPKPLPIFPCVGCG